MTSTNFRNTTLNEERVFGNLINNPTGVLPMASLPPALPPRPQFSGGGGDMMYGNNRYGFPAAQSGFHGYSPYGGFSSMDYYGHRNYGGFMGQGGYGGGYGNPAGFNYPEHRFIQLAEESSRPAFQILESLVGAVGNVATMLDSTFFAVTSSFRAVLSVAANLAHLKGTFAQFWSSLALVRAAVWLYKKMLYKLRITKTDPALEAFKEAFNLSKSAEGTGSSTAQKHSSSLLAALFMGFMLSVPYMLIKLFAPKMNEDTVSADPSRWINPLEVNVLHNFDASSPQELTIRAGQMVLLAPKQIQLDRHLLNTGWVLAAAIDRKSSGIIPLNYVQALKQMGETQ